jgi:Ser/Thr protein kinase RdoA (MazF antagonist)
LHAIRIDSTVEREKARPADIAALVARLRPKLATGAGKILDLALATCATVEVPVQRGALVWTHGDLHYENLLLTAHGALNVIDFELVGARPRETDLSYLMFMSQLKNPAAALREDGRRALVTTYLTVGGVSRSRADVDALLLDIERETPLQAIWLYVLLLPLFPWSEQVDAWLSGAFATLADAIALLKRSAADETLKQRIVNNGLLTVARATVREN